MCYNFRVKSKALFTISLCACMAIGAAAAFGSSSFSGAATSSTTHYPEIFTEYVNDNLDGLVDFATNGRSYAFADKNGIVVVENQERVQYNIKNVSALDNYNGAYCYKQGSNSYSLPSSELVDYEFSTDYSRAILADGSDYIIHTDGKGYYRAYGELSYSPLEDDNVCTKLKVYNNIAYAIISSSDKTTVKKLSGTTCTDINPSYIDFRGVEQVSLGTIKSSLVTYNLDKIHFVTLDDGSYYTQINVDNLSGEYFDAKRANTYRCGDEGAISSDETVLVLGESGNAKVFAYGNNCYIALSKNLKTDEYAEATGVEETDITNAYVTAPDWIYASPSLHASTRAVKLAAGDAVKVTGKVSTKVVGLEFYKVEFGEEDEKATGYVLSELLIPYIEGETEHPDENNFGIIKDPHYTEDDLAKIVVLLLIVIALVLIGLAYITYVLTSKKYRAFKKSGDKFDEDDKKE